MWADFKPGQCVKCNRPFNVASNVLERSNDPEPNKPKVGDATVCLGCGQIYRIGVGFVMNPVELEDLAILPETTVGHIQTFASLQAMIQRKNTK